MAFSKSFPKTIDGSNYPRWEEIFLSSEEESEQEKACRKENITVMKDCIEDAKLIFAEKNLKNFQSDLIAVAIALFEKRASHVVFWKESKTKEKFDEIFAKK